MKSKKGKAAGAVSTQGAGAGHVRAGRAAPGTWTFPLTGCGAGAVSALFVEAVSRMAVAIPFLLDTTQGLLWGDLS